MQASTKATVPTTITLTPPTPRTRPEKLGRVRVWQVAHKGINKRLKLWLINPINPGDIVIGARYAAGPRQLQQTGKSKGSCNFIRTTGASLVAKWSSARAGSCPAEIA